MKARAQVTLRIERPTGQVVERPFWLWASDAGRSFLPDTHSSAAYQLAHSKPCWMGGSTERGLGSGRVGEAQHQRRAAVLDAFRAGTTNVSELSRRFSLAQKTVLAWLRKAGLKGPPTKEWK